MKTNEQLQKELEEARSRIAEVEKQLAMREQENTLKENTLKGYSYLAEFDPDKVRWVANGWGAICDASDWEPKIREYTALGRGFRTKEDAELFAKAEKLRADMLKACIEDWQGYKLDWSDGDQIKYNLILIWDDAKNSRVGIDHWYRQNLPAPVFRTREAAEKFIDTHDCSLLGRF